MYGMAEFELFTAEGERKYVTLEERERFYATSLKYKRNTKALCHVVYHTGCRISEALELTVNKVDLDSKYIIIRCLKKRNKKNQYRLVPVPDSLINDLDNIYGIREIYAKGERYQEKLLKQPLWDWSRQNGHRLIKEVMVEANIPPGPWRCPLGLRHGFAIAAITKGVPLNVLQKWMGHSKMETTAIYANVSGKEERAIAQRMWG